MMTTDEIHAVIDGMTSAELAAVIEGRTRIGMTQVEQLTAWNLAIDAERDQS